MILIDSSVWVAFLRGSASGLVVRDLLDDPTEIATTEPVIMEILTGARSGTDYVRLRSLMLVPTLLPFDSVAAFEGAARIYRDARAHGITPAGQVDCLILAVAERRGATLLTLDAQQRRVADLLGIPG